MMCWGMWAGGELETEGKGFGKWKGVWGGGTGCVVTVTGSQQQPRAPEGTAEEKMGTVRGREKGCWRKQGREIQIKSFSESSAGLVMSEGVEGSVRPGRLMKSKAGREVDKNSQIQNIAVAGADSRMTVQGKQETLPPYDSKARLAGLG